jgi:hypothetical protein
MDFTARFVLVKPPSEEVLLQRLGVAGISGDAATAIVKTFTDIDVAKANDLFDKVIVNTDVASAAKEAESFIYETQTDAMEETPSDEAPITEVVEDNGDVAMAEAEADTAQLAGAQEGEVQEAEEAQDEQKVEAKAETPTPEAAGS